ncbi:MAG: hypothetical protein ABW058_13390 [Methylobacterium sp.]
MRTFVSSSLALAALLAAGPVLAQAQAAKPDAGAPVPAPGRSVSATGRTMPKPRNAPAEAAAKPTASEAQMLKAQKASEDRSKAWDTKMHRTMSSICHGC